MKEEEEEKAKKEDSLVWLNWLNSEFVSEEVLAGSEYPRGRGRLLYT